MNLESVKTQVKDRVKVYREKLDGWKATGADRWESLKAAVEAAAQEVRTRIDRARKKTPAPKID